MHGGLARRRGADKLDQLGVAHGFRQRVTAGERSSEQPRGSRVAQYDPFVRVEDEHAVCQVLEERRHLPAIALELLECAALPRLGALERVQQGCDFDRRLLSELAQRRLADLAGIDAAYHAPKGLRQTAAHDLDRGSREQHRRAAGQRGGWNEDLPVRDRQERQPDQQHGHHCAGDEAHR